MKKYVSEPKTRRQPRGPFIELLDVDEILSDAPATGAPSYGRAKRGANGLRILPGPSAEPGLGWLRLTAVFVAVLVVAGAGVVHVVRRAAASEPARPAMVTEPVVQTEPEAAPALPPPSESELAALENGPEDVMGEALRALRQRDVTPEGLRAIDFASRRTTDAELLRRATCYRVRGDAPLETGFSALPTTPATDGEWKRDGATCLVEAIAARASEAPERALPLLVERGLLDDTDAIMAGLAQVHADVLPAPVTEALDTAGPSPARRAAIRIAVALGAAEKWPERVATWLEDPDRSLRLHAHAQLLRQPDDASRRLAAQAIAADPADDELSRRAVEQIGKGDGFDRQLAAVAADPSQPAVARAHAADLVGLHGGPAACRFVAAIASAEPVLASKLAEARLRIEQRFGSSLQPSVRR
jgi:hypothetical protein